MPAPMYKGMKEFRFTNNVVYDYWFCRDDIKCCVNGSKKKCVLGWLIVPSTWPVNIGINMLKEEVLMLEDIGFQLHQREALSPSLQIFNNRDIFHPLAAFLDGFEPKHPPNLLIIQNSALESNNTNG